MTSDEEKKKIVLGILNMNAKTGSTLEAINSKCSYDLYFIQRID